MPKLSAISSRALIRILEKLGFEQIHQKGSHVRLKHSDGRVTTVPMHAGEKVGVDYCEKSYEMLMYLEVSLKNYVKKRWAAAASPSFPSD